MTNHVANFDGVTQIEQGRDSVITCPIELDGSAVVPSAGTVTVYNASNEKVVDGATASSLSPATYTVTAAMVSSETLGNRWRVEWTLTVATEERIFDNSAALVRRRLFPTVSHTDLYNRIPSLDPSGDHDIVDRADFQDELDAAWNYITARLEANGQRPWLIVEPTALEASLLELWISFIFQNLATHLGQDNGAQAMEMSDQARRRFEDEWARVRFDYDTDDDGDADRFDTGATSTVWLM